MDGLERDLGEQAQVLRVSVTDPTGGKLAQRYGVRSVPTFVLLDGNGEVVLTHVGIPNQDEIKAAIGPLIAQ